MIELNADIGEGCDDAALMPYLARVSIACGGHAGDASSMAGALRLASDHGVVIGAHPGYPDRIGFGRHPLAATAEEIALWVTQQTEALAEQAARQGLRLDHVKPHGALYTVAARDPAVAHAVAHAIARFDPALVLIGLADSALVSAGQAAGLAVLREAFADRRYQPDGRLVSRETEGALLCEPEAAARQARALAHGEPIEACDGARLTIHADTVCLHGDTPNALKIAAAIHAALNRG